MAEEPLKRLLDAEAKAERVIAAADDERRGIVEQARLEILESERRYAERASALRASASTLERPALDAAVNLLTRSGEAAT